MERLKFLAKSIAILMTLFVLTSSVISPVSILDAETPVLATKTTKKLTHKTKEERSKRYQEALNKALTSYFEKAIARGEIVGAGVSIVKGDSIQLSEGFGKRNFKGEKAIDGETVFRLGSLSKGFAGVLAAYLTCEGELEWSDRVNDYIPEFHLGDTNNTENITLANILSHTSGAPYHSYTNLIEAGLPLTEIASRFQEVTPIDKPSHTYSYQNAMFALCGVMMYKETGQDIKTLLNTKLFKPLNMDNVSMEYEDLAHSENIAMPHLKRRYGWKPLKLNHHYYNAVAAGGINASAEDMGKWMEFLLGHHPEVMDKASLQAVFNPFVEIKGRSKYYQRWPGHVSSYYGFGWRIHEFKDQDTKELKTMYHHGGSVNEYRNEIAVFPEDDLGICVLMNSHTRLASRVIPELYEIVNKVFEEVNSADTNKLIASVDSCTDSDS